MLVVVLALLFAQAGDVCAWDVRLNSGFGRGCPPLRQAPAPVRTFQIMQFELNLSASIMILERSSQEREKEAPSDIC
jgi:hypothetical protein